jgi:hypothetical protein
MGGESLKNMCSRMKRSFSFISINLSFNTSSLWCTIITDEILTPCHALSAIFLDDVTTTVRSRQTAGMGSCQAE